MAAMGISWLSHERKLLTVECRFYAPDTWSRSWSWALGYSGCLGLLGCFGLCLRHRRHEGIFRVFPGRLAASARWLRHRRLAR